MRLRNQQVRGYIFVLLATMIWSGNFIVARFLADAVPPITLVMLRSCIALIALFPFALKSLRKDSHLFRKYSGYIIITGFFGMSVCNSLVYIAAATTKALNMTLIAIASPIFTLLFARLFLSDVLTVKRVLGLFIATSGVILLITEAEPGRLIHLTFSRGDLWMLGQASSFALYSILIRKKPPELEPLSFLFALFAVGGILLLPFFFYEIPRLTALAWTPQILISVLYLGIGPSLLAYLFWNKSVSIIGPSRAAFVYYTLPLFSGLEALLWLNEPISLFHVLSGFLILTGILISTRD